MILYRVLYVWVKWCCSIFFRRLWVKHADIVPSSGPVLLVANHPNSFMDAILIALSLKRPMHFLARGDAFKNPLLNKVFRALQMLPVYRASEGVENISRNQQTFDAVHEALVKGGIVLIFGEGLCEHNWKLRPQKKGAARIVQRAWEAEETRTLKVIPIGLTYEHFNGGGKSAVICYGKPIDSNSWTGERKGASFVRLFNTEIAQQIRQLAYFNEQIEPNTPQHLHMTALWHKAELTGGDVLDVLYANEVNAESAKSVQQKLSRLQSSVVGMPHYFMMQLIARRTTKDSVFYDSVLFGLVVLLLPAYVASFFLILIFIFT